ncbi:hypothetical protein [Bacillus xiapuensis]|uniref:Uncharacterized protein n=1 Tax=Bacillus xiapuensis TaxID=2014075 RepID=A0ABU6N6E1_9BACI|nr:hypothetical protein [Bacillus xiapuensis]
MPIIVSGKFIIQSENILLKVENKPSKLESIWWFEENKLKSLIKLVMECEGFFKIMIGSPLFSTKLRVLRANKYRVESISFKVKNILLKWKINHLNWKVFGGLWKGHHKFHY